MKTIRLSLSALILAVSLTSFIGCVSVHRDEPTTTRSTTTTSVPSGTTVQRTTTY